MALELAEQKRDLASIARFTDQLGRYKAMFTDKVKSEGPDLVINVQDRPKKEVISSQVAESKGVTNGEVPKLR